MISEQMAIRGDGQKGKSEELLTDHGSHATFEQTLYKEGEK